MLRVQGTQQYRHSLLLTSMSNRICCATNCSRSLSALSSPLSPLPLSERVASRENATRSKEKPYTTKETQVVGWLAPLQLTIELLTDISLSERARLVHPWPLRAPTWKSPPFFTRRTFPAALCFLHFSGHFWVFFSFFLVLFRVRACTQSTAPRASAGVSGCWRVEGGLKGVRSPLSCLGVACTSRHEGSVNGLCLASVCLTP